MKFPWALYMMRYLSGVAALLIRCGKGERWTSGVSCPAQDPKHLEQIKEFITFQGFIDHREDRAITLPQLKMVSLRAVTAANK